MRKTKKKKKFIYQDIFITYILNFAKKLELTLDETQERMAE